MKELWRSECFDANDARGRRLLQIVTKNCLQIETAPLIVNRMVKYSSRILNRTFAALADPTRRRILAHLARGDTRVTDLARPHAMSLPAVSKHLRVLEKAGLLRRRRYGRVHEMQLDAKPLKQAAQWVEEYRKFWEGSLDRLAEYLEKTSKTETRKENNLCVRYALRTGGGAGGELEFRRRMTAFALGKFLKNEKQTKKKRQDEKCKKLDRRHRLTRGVGSCTSEATREGEGVDPRS